MVLEHISCRRRRVLLTEQTVMTCTFQANQIACAYVPDFLFQLSLRELPEDFRLPVALVDRNDGRAIIMAVDKRAAKRGIFPGLSYANAIGLCPDLHATYPHPQQVNQLHKRLINHLGLFSPAVEPVAELFGAYYLDVSGMARLEPDLCVWGKRLRDALMKEENLQATVVVGFTRFGVRTAACSVSGITVFKSPGSEQAAALATPLKRLSLPGKPLKELEKLNIQTVGDLKVLPDWEVRSRFAEPMFDLVRKAKEQDSAVHGIQLSEPYSTKAEFDYTENDAERLVAVIQQLCAPLLERMKIHSQGVGAIHLGLTKDYGGICNEKVQTAKPTLSMPTLTDLLRLRLHAVELSEGVTGLEVRLIPCALPNPQVNLHPALVKSEQTILRANRAIARIRAEFGTEIILRAKCHKAHLPQDSFKWERFDQLQNKVSKQPVSASVMRRFLDHPRRMSAPYHASPQRVLGPYSTSGFWWRQNSIQRNDYFVETESGDTQWIFFDKNNRRWYAQGFVQ